MDPGVKTMNKVFMRILARQLRKRGRELKLSDAEIARRTGLSERRYGHYVTGAREPSLEILVKICATLATTPDGLLEIGESGASRAADGRGRDQEERKMLIGRLAAAANALEIDDVRLAVKQIETLLHHRREQK